MALESRQLVTVGYFLDDGPDGGMHVTMRAHGLDEVDRIRQERAKAQRAEISPGKFSDFRDALLLALVEEREKDPDHALPAAEVAHAMNCDPADGWVDLAVEAMAARGLVRVMGDTHGAGLLVSVTGLGLEEAERLLEVMQEEQDRSEVSSGAPASDRVVPLDHNAQGYKDAVKATDDVIEAVRGSNDFKTKNPEAHEQRLAELEAGKRLLTAARVRVAALAAVLVVALKWLLDAFGAGVIGKLAEVALAKLAPLLPFAL